MTTRARLAKVAASAFCVSMMASSGLAQTFSCDPHPPTGCDSYVLLDTRYDVHLGTDIDDVKEEVMGTPWQKGGHCNCICVQTGSPIWKSPEQCPPAEYSVSHELQYSWNIGVTAGSTAHIELSNILLGAVGLDVSLTVEFDYSHSDTVERSWTLPVIRLNCFDHFGRMAWVQRSIKGSITKAKVQQEWGCTVGQTSTIIETNCGMHTVSGEASNFSQVNFDYTDPPICCHGPNPPDPDHGGKTDETCAEIACSKITGCPGEGCHEESVSGTACGLWGEN